MPINDGDHVRQDLNATASSGGSLSINSNMLTLLDSLLKILRVVKLFIIASFRCVLDVYMCS